LWLGLPLNRVQNGIITLNAMPSDLRFLEGFVLGISFCLASRGLWLVVNSRVRRMEGFSEFFFGAAPFALALAIELRSIAVYALSALLIAGSWWSLWQARRQPSPDR
jgi:hypothetical protein